MQEREVNPAGLAERAARARTVETFEEHERESEGEPEEARADERGIDEGRAEGESEEEAEGAHAEVAAGGHEGTGRGSDAATGGGGRRAADVLEALEEAEGGEGAEEREREDPEDPDMDPPQIQPESHARKEVVEGGFGDAPRALAAVQAGSSRGFNGLGAAQVQDGEYVYTPTDMAIAASRDHMVHAINAVVTIYTLNPDTGLPSPSGPTKTVALSTFFNAVLPADYFASFTDPTLAFDKASGRFLLTTWGFDEYLDALNPARLYVAASAGSDPTGAWHLYALKWPPQGLCDEASYGLPDFPRLSYDEHVILLTVNHMCLAPVGGPESAAPFAIALSKAAVYGGRALARAPAYHLPALSGVRTIYKAQPVTPMAADDVGNGVYLAAQDFANTALLHFMLLMNTDNIHDYSSGLPGSRPPQLCAPREWQGVYKGAAYPSDAVVSVPLEQPPFSNGTAAQELDSGRTNTVYGASMRDGLIYIATKAYAGGTCTGADSLPLGCRPSVYWGVFTPLDKSGVFSPALIPGQAGIVHHNDYGLAYPSLAVMANGSALLVYTVSSNAWPRPSQPVYPGMGATLLDKRLDQDVWTQGGISIIKPGVGPLVQPEADGCGAEGLPACRLGDYSAADVVPGDGAGRAERVYGAVDISQLPGVDFGVGAWINLF